MEKKGTDWEPLQSQNTSQLLCQGGMPGGEGREFSGCRWTRMSQREALIQARINLLPPSSLLLITNSGACSQPSSLPEFHAAGIPGYWKPFLCSKLFFSQLIISLALTSCRCLCSRCPALTPACPPQGVDNPNFSSLLAFPWQVGIPWSRETLSCMGRRKSLLPPVPNSLGMF